MSNFGIAPLTLPQLDNGTVTKSPDLEAYPAGTEVTLTATPNDGYEFTKWIIGESEFTDSPLTFTIEVDTTVTPEFEEKSEILVHYDTLDHVHESHNRPHRSTKA